MAKPKSVEILGIPVSSATLEQGISAAQKLMTDSKRAHYAVLPYVEFVMTARRDPAVRAALIESDLCLPNGVALNWAAEYLYDGKPSAWRVVSSGAQIVFRPNTVHQILPARFDSANFTYALLRQAAETGQTVFLIGSPKRQSIDAVGAYLAGAVPKLTIAGTFTGHLNPAKEQELVAKLQASQPALILVGMGFPRQELLMQRLRPQLAGGLMIGEGGSFDYQDFGGHIKRAPTWIRRSGLEWLWRLVREPSRLRRQLAIPAFIWQIYLEGRRLGRD